MFDELVVTFHGTCNALLFGWLQIASHTVFPLRIKNKEPAMGYKRTTDFHAFFHHKCLFLFPKICLQNIY